jgi:hypothetical protein
MSENSVGSRKRRLLFISHANPEDNEFSMWLSAQLALHGYETWLDIEKLKGGERFWNSIQAAIENESAKVLPVITKVSNSRDGVLNEIHVALGVERRLHLKDFVIPLHLDDLPYGQMDIRIQSRQAVPFENGWAHGLRLLLAKLEEDNVPRCSDVNREAVAKWWEACTCPVKLDSRQETYTSNWFPAVVPGVLYQHQIDILNTDKNLASRVLEERVTGVTYRDYLFSFSPALELDKALGDSVAIKGSLSQNRLDFLRYGARMVRRKEARDIFVQLLQQVWNGNPRVSRLLKYQLANGAEALYFPVDAVGLSRVRVPGGSKGRARQLVGTWHSTSVTGKKKKHYWHFAIQARPMVYPLIGYMVKPHVLFSEDGKEVWDDKERIHKARRTQCRDWWNRVWRDRILASLAWLAESDDCFVISVPGNSAIEVSLKPVEFVSPLSYTEPGGQPTVYADEEELSDEVSSGLHT